MFFANDVGISKSERFKGYEDKILQTKPHDRHKRSKYYFLEKNRYFKKRGKTKIFMKGRETNEM